MQVLVIGQEIKDKIAVLRKFAEGHAISKEDIQGILAGTNPPARFRPDHWIEIPIYYRLVFSIDQTELGAYRHASIWVTHKQGKYPNPFACQEILDLLGFTEKIVDRKDMTVWEEEGCIMNFAEPMV